ncbi:hypothetical protein [Rhizobium sp. 2MFCol3.1]|uniref:hypothetical protein n=1 Tax=Rhizobium sp. 2MFCol3.1 TaxID=1246459 RepID=UPI00039BC3F1|nr:hypothetical protein [Rhizobium sp. 2MFCol3.1]
MNISKSITRSAGVDVSKPWLDAALHGCEATLRVANTSAGHRELIDWGCQGCVARWVGGNRRL